MSECYKVWHRGEKTTQKVKRRQGGEKGAEWAMVGAWHTILQR